MLKQVAGGDGKMGGVKININMTFDKKRRRTHLLSSTNISEIIQWTISLNNSKVRTTLRYRTFESFSKRR